MYTQPKIILEHIDGEEWVIREEIITTVSNNKNTYTIRILPGFITDGASIPKVVHMLINPFDSIWALASTVHDALYVKKITTREEADLIFLQLMLDNVNDESLSWYNRIIQTTFSWVAYRSVRIGGWVYWSRDKSEEQQNLVQVNTIGL